MIETTTSPMTGFSHIQLLVGDLTVSEQWYTTALGMERFAASEEHGYVALRHRGSGVSIVLSLRSDGESGRGPLDHLAFGVPDGATLQSWADHLTAAGIEHPEIVLELGKPSLQLLDPDGNSIELVAPTSPG